MVVDIEYSYSDASWWEAADSYYSFSYEKEGHDPVAVVVDWVVYFPWPDVVVVVDDEDGTVGIADAFDFWNIVGVAWY